MGNRLSETTNTGTTDYDYDIANRLTGAGGVSYTWDANGNLLDDESYAYSYDHANRLKTVSGQEVSASYAYNGLGVRVQETAGGITTHYVVVLNAGLSQVLSDGTFTYLYGMGRIAQQSTADMQYFLGDALGSVRQLTDSNGELILAKDYEPYGDMLNRGGNGTTSYGFAGEWTDGYIELVNLRSGCMTPELDGFSPKIRGRGIIPGRCHTINGCMLTRILINLVDPSGHFPVWCQYAPSKALYEGCVLAFYQVEPINYLSLGSNITGQKGCYKGKIDYRAPGYLEGVGGFVGPLLGDYIPSTWGGVETVYDFAAMERSSFLYTGPGISDAFLGVGIAQYGGGVAGFRSDRDIIRDYGGPFWVLQGGVSVDFFIGFGAGIGGFVSTSDTLMRGVTWYVGGSISLSDWIEWIDVGGAYLDYKPVEGSRKSYVLSDGSINKVSLLSDIISGNQSPWLASNQPFLQARIYSQY